MIVRPEPKANSSASLKTNPNEHRDEKMQQQDPFEMAKAFVYRYRP
jgi:hypothetical protein